MSITLREFGIALRYFGGKCKLGSRESPSLRTVSTSQPSICMCMRLDPSRAGIDHRMLGARNLRHRHIPLGPSSILEHIRRTASRHTCKPSHPNSSQVHICQQSLCIHIGSFVRSTPGDLSTLVSRKRIYKAHCPRKILVCTRRIPCRHTGRDPNSNTG